VQSVDSKVQIIESKMHIFDSHSQFIAKLEAQIGQLVITVDKRKEGKFSSLPIQNPKGQQFEQLKVVMVLRSGKEVENKVSENEHNKEKRLKTMESDLEFEKENDTSSSLVMSDPTVLYKPRVPYP